MHNFDPYNVLLDISTNISVLLMTASVLQGHILYMFEETIKDRPRQIHLSSFIK